MALNNTTADALAATLVTALGLTGTEATTALPRLKTFCETLYAHLKADIVITIQTATIVTTGGPTTQTGPAAPINISPQ
jgi:hypothetical protein